MQSVTQSVADTQHTTVNFDSLEQHLEMHRSRFQSEKPFRFIVIDGFCHAEAALSLAQQFPSKDPNWIDASGQHAKKKWTSPIIPHSIAEGFFKEVQSDRFTKWLEQVTGMNGFIHDDAFFGAGFHQTLDGGFLNVHIDFNKLPNGLDRRLNLLVYMNLKWEEDWGGDLELWDMSRTECIKSISPIFNRAVIFETNEISYHGHPKPVNTNGMATRNSFSVYYYTQGRPEEERAEQHSTLYLNTEGASGSKKIFLNTLHQIVTLKPLFRRLRDRLR